VLLLDDCGRLCVMVESLYVVCDCLLNALVTVFCGLVERLDTALPLKSAAARSPPVNRFD